MKCEWKKLVRGKYENMGEEQRNDKNTRAFHPSNNIAQSGLESDEICIYFGRCALSEREMATHQLDAAKKQSECHSLKTSHILFIMYANAFCQ